MQANYIARRLWAGFIATVLFIGMAGFSASVFADTIIYATLIGGDSVRGAADDVDANPLGYIPESEGDVYNTYIGTGGGGGDIRYHNPIIVFELPEWGPVAEATLTIHTAGSRGKPYAHDVTAFVQTFYDGATRLHDRIYFRLSADRANPNLARRRREIVNHTGDALAPTLQLVIPAPPEEQNVESLPDLLELDAGMLEDGERRSVIQYFEDQPGGGGIYRWHASMPKAEHDGRVVVDPDVTWTGLQADISQLAQHIDPERAGTGCWVLEDEFARAGSQRREAFFEAKQGAFVLIAHRGREMDLAPDNTIGGLNALPPGVRAVETDVRFTADDVAVAFHDSTLDARTDGTGTLSQITFEDLQELDAGSWVGPEWIGERVPRIADYLEACKQLGVEYVMLDSKVLSTPAHAQAYVDLIRDADMLDQVIIMLTGDQAPDAAGLVRALDDEVMLGSFRLDPDNKEHWIRAGRLFNYVLILSRPRNQGFDDGWPLYPQVMENGIIPGTSTLNNADRMAFAAEQTAAVFSLTDHFSQFVHLQREGVAGGMD